MDACLKTAKNEQTKNKNNNSNKLPRVVAVICCPAVCISDMNVWEQYQIRHKPTSFFYSSLVKSERTWQCRKELKLEIKQTAKYFFRINIDSQQMEIFA